MVPGRNGGVAGLFAVVVLRLIPVARHTTREVNTERLAALYDLHSEAIYRYCFFRVFSKEHAEELMQETFLKIWQYIKEGKTIDNERALLYTIATHLVIDSKRKKREQSLEQMMESSEAMEPVAAGGHEASAHGAMLREVHEELKKLSADEQELFTMRFVSDLDPKEIAEMKGTSANVISVKINRILNKVRATLA